LLADRSAEDIRALIPKEDFILDNGKRLAFDDFIADVERAAQQGYCCTEGLSGTFRYCMAAPLTDRENRPVAALCFMTGRDTSTEKRAHMLDDLIRAAKSL